MRVPAPQLLTLSSAVCAQTLSLAAQRRPPPSKAESRVLHRVLPLLFLVPPEHLLLELQPVGEEHLPPADLSGLCPHVRGDVVTGPLNDLLPEHITLAQLWGGGIGEGRVR